MKKQVAAVATMAVSSLVLSGCAAIMAFPQPAGVCDGETVSISVSPNNPDFFGVADESETFLTIDFEGNLEDVEISYALGIFNETGLNTVSGEYLNLVDDVPLRDDAEAESFMHFADGASITLDETYFEPTSSPGQYQLVAPFSVIVTEGSIDSDFDEEVMYAMLALILSPGAFLVECTADGASQNGEYVAAAQLFPNLVVLQGEDFPVLSITGETVDFSLPVEYAGAQVNLIAQVREAGDPRLSEDPATDRWLQALSTTQEDFEKGDVIEASGIVGEAGSLNDLSFDSGRFQAGKTYNIILLIAENELSDFQTVIFDAVIDESGEATFTAFEGEFISVQSPSRGGGYRAPAITDSRLMIDASSRGLREISIEGTAMNKVNSVKVGTKQAKIVSSEEARLTIRLPKLATGVYDLAMTHNRGEVIQKGIIKITASQKLTQITIANSVRKADWLPRLSASLKGNKATIQVDCVARVPQGSKPAALKKKASAICSQVSDDSIKTRVVVKKAPASSSSAVAVKFWD